MTAMTSSLLLSLHNNAEENAPVRQSRLVPSVALRGFFQHLSFIAIVCLPPTPEMLSNGLVS
jgi:hypothetical protein